MSGLAGLLAGRREPGVYRWHASFSVDDVRHAVEHAGWRFAYLDGWHGETKQEFLVAIGEALAFPDHYGRNFDALTDCLRDVGVDEQGRGIVVLWDGWGPFAHHDPAAYAVALDVLAERAAQPRGPLFAALLRGEGPEPPHLASLD